MLETYKSDLKGRKSIEESILARYGMNEPVLQFTHAGTCVSAVCCRYVLPARRVFPDPDFSRLGCDDLSITLVCNSALSRISLPANVLRWSSCGFAV